MALDLDQFDTQLNNHDLSGLGGYLEAEQIAARLRPESPMIPSYSIDAVISNYVIKLQ